MASSARMRWELAEDWTYCGWIWKARRSRQRRHLVPRLTGFLVKHRANVRHGFVPEDYVRHLEYKGQEVVLASETKGYRFELIGTFMGTRFRIFRWYHSSERSLRERRCYNGES